tara:strand:- start:128 stop:1015 length:888 start_codon:yes stop_codon:yes gene_type:complete
MKLFIKNILYFSTGLLIINFIFYIFIFKPLIYNKYIYNNSIDNYNVFLVSDSHGAVLANIPSEHGIFNLSKTSDNYFDMYLKIQYFIELLDENDTILLAIDNHSLSSYRNKSINLNQSILYVSDYDILDDKVTINRFYFKNIFQYFPLFDVDYNRIILEYLYYQLIGLNEHRKFIHFSNEDIDILIKNRYKTQFSQKSQDVDQVKYLKSIINICKDKKIRLIGIKFPIIKKYLEIIKDEDFGIEELWKSNNLEIIDLQNIYSDQDNYFKDQDHLNKIGAIDLCSKIKSSLINIDD